jgi:site-specific recombinase XerD
MLSDQGITACRGVNFVAAFLGSQLIETSPNSLLEHAASLKKFYTYLNEEGKTSDEELLAVKNTIKIEMPEWLAIMAIRRPNDTTHQHDEGELTSQALPLLHSFPKYHPTLPD